MKKEILFLVFFCLLSFSSCHNNRSQQSTEQAQNDTILGKGNNTESSINEEDMKYFNLKTETYEGKDKLLKYIEKLKTEYTETGRNSLNLVYTTENLPLILPVTSLLLTKTGYIAPTEDEFNRQIAIYFKMDKIGRKISDHIPLCFEYEINDDDLYDSMLNYSSFYFSPKYRLVYKYTDEDIAISSNKIDGPEALYYSHLSSRTVHINQFIFHNSNASLTWLVNNYPDFLEFMLTEAGYDESPRINKVVLDKRLEEFQDRKNPNSNEHYYHLFSNKDYNTGNLIVHEGLLKYIVATSTVEDPTYSYMLAAYAYLIVSEDKDAKSLQEGLSKAECYKVAAYMGYYEMLAREKNNIDNPDNPDVLIPGWGGGFFRNELVGNKEFLKALEDNNFYNIPRLKDMISGVMCAIDYANMKVDPNYKPSKYFSN